eukprot:1463522-Prorocentrum_lima.AAC.1
MMREERLDILAIQGARYKEDMEMEVEGYKVITTAAWKGTHGVAMIIQQKWAHRILTASQRSVGEDFHVTQ